MLGLPYLGVSSGGRTRWKHPGEKWRDWKKMVRFRFATALLFSSSQNSLKSMHLFLLPCLIIK